MRVLKIAVMMSTLGAAAACGREAKPAQPQQNLTWLDSMMVQPAQPAAASAMELNQAPVPQPAAQPQALASVAEKPATSSTTTHHTSSTSHHRSARRSSSGSSGTYAGPVYTQRRTYTVKHTRRDAAIGAAGGAVIGAVAGGGRHRVRGAIVGGVLGGVAGAVIGNNVDKHRISY
jgi:hypothetical protein